MDPNEGEFDEGFESDGDGGDGIEMIDPNDAGEIIELDDGHPEGIYVIGDRYFEAIRRNVDNNIPTHKTRVYFLVIHVFACVIIMKMKWWKDLEIWI